MCVLFCLSLTGCLFPSVDRDPILVLDVSPREGYLPLVVAFDASKSFDPEGKVVTIHWDFDDGDTAEGNQVSHTYASEGSYQVRVTIADPQGNDALAIIPIVVRAIPAGYTLRTFRWVRNGEARTWDMLIPYDLYQDYKGRLRNSPYIDKYDDFVRDPEDDPTLGDYALTLWNRAGQDQGEFIQETLAFVQGAIRYQADPPGIDHPFYPLETLADGYGDCEDTAILYVSLLQEMDVDCKLAFVDTQGDGTPDHVLVLVAVTNQLLSELTCSSTVVPFEWSDGHFVVAETAVDQGVYGLGCDPWGLDEEDLAELWSFPDS